MSRKMITALKRISNDIKALEKCPLEGIGLVSMGEDPLKFIINMQLMDGPYQGYKLQLLMSMTEDYPIKPPKVPIRPLTAAITIISSMIILQTGSRNSVSTSSTTNSIWILTPNTPDGILRIR